MTDTDTPPPKRPINRIALVLDASGSMQSLGGQPVATFNDYLRSIREGAAQHDQETSVSILTFASRVSQVAANIPAARAREMPAYRPDGQTALFDAVGQAIDDFRAMPDAAEEHVSCVVMAITDGQENASLRYNEAKLRKLLAEVQATDRYTVAFLVPRGQSRVLLGFGIPAGNIREWETTSAGLRETQAAAASAFDGFYTQRGQGKRSTGAFFTNVAQLSKADVQAACRNIAGDVLIFRVTAREDIKDFCERHTGKPYTKGAAFYQLTKAETVQHNKRVIIVEKAGSAAIYAGDDARRLIGLPSGDARVRPGDHGQWDVFVQSTSVNRKLEAGTRVIYQEQP